MIDLLKKIKIKSQKTKKIEKKNYIFQTLLDLSLLFKNIIHWNISKIALYLGGILLGLLLSLLFFVIYNIFGGMPFIDIYTSLFSGISISSFNGFLVNVIYLYKSFSYMILLAFTLDFINIIYLIGGILFLLSFFYPNLIYIKLYNGYINGKKYSLKDLDILNIRKFVKFINLTLLNLVVLLIPVIVFFLLLGLLALFSGNLEELNTLVASGSNNYFSIISFILLIVCSLWLIYLLFRIIFSYFVLAINYEKSRSVYSYLKEGFKSTKGFNLFIKFFSLSALFIMFILPFKYLGFVISLNGTVVNVLTIIFSLMAFIFLYGLYIMVMTSFYEREIK